MMAREDRNEGGKAMNQKKVISIIVFALVLAIPQTLHSGSHYTYIHSPKDDVYFGYITYTEVEHDGQDPVVIREGEEAPQIAVLNFPLLPGDTVRTSAIRRCEIQLDTGTIIRLDRDTELKIETIMAKSLSTFHKITNFLLNKGQIFIMYKRYNYPEIFQVITPNASVKLRHKTVAMVAVRADGSTDIQVNRGKANVLYGADKDHLTAEIVNKSRRMTVLKSHRALHRESRQDVDFELWNESVNQNFEELHRGMAVIPEPILRYPRAVIYFARKYSSLYGEWIWNNLYGYVWRPSSNDLYPLGSWRPYYLGQWREVNGQLFWVPQESWGWVPYHLGLWVWNKKQGWLWIPGSAFSPAWVAWNFHMGYFCWRPWSLWDWYLYGSGYYSGFPYYWSPYMYGPFDDNNGMPLVEGRKVLHSIRKAQLQKQPPSYYPLLKEYQGSLKKIIAAVKNGDEGLLASIKESIKQMVVVKKEDLNAANIQEKTISFQSLSLPLERNSRSQKLLKDPFREAVRTFKENAAGLSSQNTASVETPGKRKDTGTSPKKAAGSVASRERTAAQDPASRRIVDSRNAEIRDNPAQIKTAPGSMVIRPSRLFMSEIRFRDWNPDSAVARWAGVSLKYSSSTNEIHCPELNLTSRSVRRARNMVTMTGISPPAGGSSHSFSRDDSSSSSSSSSSRSGSSRSSSSRSSGSSRGAGSRGSTVKK